MLRVLPREDDMEDGETELTLGSFDLCGPLETNDLVHRSRLPSLCGGLGYFAGQPSQELRYGPHRGTGALWRVYELASPVQRTSLDSRPFVLKMAIPSIPCGNPEDQGSYTAIQAAAAVLNECQLLLGPLEDLQGSLVPKVFGIYVTKLNGVDAWGMVVEDCGNPIWLPDLQPRHK